MRLQGNVVGRGFASQPNCPTVPYDLILPDGRPENIVLLTREIARWQYVTNEYERFALKGTLTADVVKRAQFGVDVLSQALKNIEMRICCCMIAADADGSVLGVMVYFIVSPTEATIALLVVDPMFLAGSPYTTKLRGIGTSIVAAAADQMQKLGVNHIDLHPLDSEAERFWKGRGFRITGLGHLLSVHGDDAITRLQGSCKLRPDHGDTIYCGLPPKVREKALVH